jgi:hypothetical protein
MVIHFAQKKQKYSKNNGQSECGRIGKPNYRHNEENKPKQKRDFQSLQQAIRFLLLI